MKTIGVTTVVLSFVLGAALGLGGCEVEVDFKSEGSSQAQTDQLVEPIKNQHITGEVRGNKFRIEQAILQNSTLELRQGEEFFADISVEVIIPDNEGFEGKTFNSSQSFGLFQPRIRLSIKKEGEGLPDQKLLMDDFELLLTFGQKKDLGIPFSIRLVSLENESSIEGNSFATYENIRVVGDVIDSQFDNFDTLEYLAKQYISKQLDDPELGDKFGVGFSGYGNDYPKSGFVGYEAINSSGEPSIIKIQLAKDKNGWKVIKQLNTNQIHQAHPVVTDIEGSYRTVEGLKANTVAAQKLEAELNKQGIIESVRSTSMRCYLTGEAHRASCSATYGLKVKDQVQCHDKNYLFINDGNGWEFESVILDNQKMDSTSGELVAKKPAVKKKGFLEGLFSNC